MQETHFKYLNFALDLCLCLALGSKFFVRYGYLFCLHMFNRERKDREHTSFCQPVLHHFLPHSFLAQCRVLSKMAIEYKLISITTHLGEDALERDPVSYHGLFLSKSLTKDEITLKICHLNVLVTGLHG